MSRYTIPETVEEWKFKAARWGYVVEEHKPCDFIALDKRGRICGSWALNGEEWLKVGRVKKA